jgi:alpha-2-macroglobulin
MMVIVTDLKTTEPLGGVKLEIYNFQNVLLTSISTDNNGIAKVKLENQPFLLIAKKDEQRGYLKLDNGSSLSLSQFDVSGNSVKNGVKGFIYGERGVWRPGDTLFLNFILEDKTGNIPENYPVIMELWDAQGKLYRKLTRTDGLNGFYHFRFITDPDVPTGSWRAIVTLGGLEFNSLVRIETVKPNRLKIKLDFGKEEISSNQSENKAKLSANWLHGTPASNLKTSISVNLFPGTTVFKGFENYTFTDPVKGFNYTENEIFNGTLDENGEAIIFPEFNVDNTSPGKLRASFTTRVFEKGGDFSIDQFSLSFSPYSKYLGIKAPEGDKFGILITDTLQNFEIVVVDESGNKTNVKNIELNIYKLNWKWWWHSTEENLASYMGSSYNKPVLNKIINTKNGIGNFNFKVDYPEWGRYLVRINDPDGKHSAGIIVYFDWPGWVNRSSRKDPNAAAILSVSSDKVKYNVGETATITIPSGKEGRALVSLESGTKVIDHYWIKTTEKESIISFKVTSQMTPNIYVNVSLIQPHAQTRNDLPVRMYGVIPVFVEDPSTRLSPVIDVPEVIRPETQFEVVVSEKEGREMTYTVAVVDEGLLDLTRFKTPDPWSTFYSREALGVKTFDLYDMVLGAYGGRIDGVFSIGGGEDEGGEPAQAKANRFMPMVRFIGPFNLLKGKTNNHTISVPNYIGSVKVMLVAGYKGAYGKAEKVIPVRKPLMILSSLPRIIGPGEKLSIPVTVFAMEEQIKKVNLKVENNQMFTLTISEKNVNFDKIGDQTIDFEAVVGKDLGIGKIKILGKSGTEKAYDESEIDVRSPNPPVTEFYYGIIDPGKTWEKDFMLPGIRGSNSGMLEVSSLPPIDFGRRLKFLLDYPYGCLEQTTSIAFPQLYLSDIMDVTENYLSIIDRNIKAAIQSIQKFQLPGGGLGLWPNSTLENEWGTSYAGHFMLEAQKKGYAISKDWLKNWIKYQKNEARRWSGVKSETKLQQRAMELNQAYRLYSLALEGEPELGAMNRLREKSDLDVSAGWILASTYAISGQKETAGEMVKTLTTEILDYQDSWYTYGSALRDKGFILETMTLLNKREEAIPLLQFISENLTSDSWYSTQTTAVCLMAVAKFAGSGKTSSDISYQYYVNKGNLQKAATNNPFSQLKLDFEKREDGQIKISNTGKGVLFVRLSLNGKPAAGQEKITNQNLNLTYKYKDMNGNIIDVSRMEQGTDFICEVTIQNPGILNSYQNMALTQIIPSGWEIQNLRLFESNIGDYAAPVYQDYRDDRVYSYFSLTKNESKTFAIKLTAAYKGKFYLPGIKCEEMYRNDIQSVTRGEWIEVISPK